MPPERCCICLSRAVKRTYPSNDFECDFIGCFGVQPMLGRLCSTDRNIILQFRKDGISRTDRVDLKGKIGQKGHLTRGGKRDKIASPVLAAVPEEAIPSNNAETEHDEVVITTTSSTATTTSSASSSQTTTTSESSCQCVASKRLANLTDLTGTEPLNRSQQVLLHNLSAQALKTEATGTHVKNFQTRPLHGPGLNMFAARRTRIGSSQCSNQTRNNRTEAIEEFQARMSCHETLNTDEYSKSLTAQRATTLKRRKSEYQAALEKAGFKSVAKFSRETVLDLRSRMPMNAWQYLKRSLHKELGVNLMGTERQLKEEVKALDFEYECVSFSDDATGKTIHAIRATDVADVIVTAVEHLRKTQQLQFVDNLSPETLWVHISGDKGGRSTKLMLQIINASNRHSIKSARVLGMFEGGKDSRHNIEMAFTPVFNQLKELGVTFSLDLDLPAAPEPPVTTSSTSDTNSEYFRI